MLENNDFIIARNFFQNLSFNNLLFIHLNCSFIYIYAYLPTSNPFGLLFLRRQLKFLYIVNIIIIQSLSHTYNLKFDVKFFKLVKSK